MPIISIFISGASGRMGMEIKKIVENSSHSFKICGSLTKDSLNGESEKADLLIDFSLPSALDKVIHLCELKKCPLLTGTTGYTDADFKKLEQLSSLVPVFWSSNMSLGVYLFHKLIEVFAQSKKSEFKFTIHEVHHTKKVDQPSGTALSLAKTAENNHLSLDGVTSARSGDVPGTHIFKAQGPSEEITISHEALNRSLFAEGALNVGHWLVEQPPGLYEMKDFVSSLS